MSFNPFQKGSSRLMLVLCPARTTDRLTIADFMEHAPRIARYLRKRSRIIGTIVEPKRPTGCGPMLSQTLRKLDLCIEAECVAVESALQRLARLKLRLLCRHKRRPGARRAVCSAAISRTSREPSFSEQRARGTVLSDRQFRNCGKPPCHSRLRQVTPVRSVRPEDGVNRRVQVVNLTVGASGPKSGK
jgi:hypothetical protein